MISFYKFFKKKCAVIFKHFFSNHYHLLFKIPETCHGGICVAIDPNVKHFILYSRGRPIDSKIKEMYKA